jgi:metal-responsive CopG/Arc/MetJ family transcriptional regulator
MKREILQRIEVRIPAAFNQALDKMRLLGGVKKSDAVTEALKRFFEDFDQSDIKKLRK